VNAHSALSSVRDRLGFVGRRWRIVVVATVVAAVLAGALSLARSKSYTAVAGLRVQDPSADLLAVGLAQSSSAQIGAQLAAQSAQIADRSDILTAVKRRLKLRQSVDDLQGHVAGFSDPISGTARITATASTSRGAADLANASAGAIVAVMNQATRLHYKAVAQSLRGQIKVLGASLPKHPETLTGTRRAEYQNNLRQQEELGGQAARLEALSEVTAPVQIASPAVRPKRASSSGPLRAAFLGGVLGLIIGLIAAWFADRDRGEPVDEEIGRRPAAVSEAEDVPQHVRRVP
jgi:capsular polysaccharide biosynthesis protein